MSQDHEAGRATDFRSDAVTTPTDAMYAAMGEARLAWAPAGDDPTLGALEDYAARIVGKASALFVPTGTMANLLALMTHTERGQQVVVEADAHVSWSEEWSCGYICGVIPATIESEDGRMTPDGLERALAARRFGHVPRTGLVWLENTHNVSGGLAMSAAEMASIAAAARAHRVPIHLDGARLFNAALAMDQEPAMLAAHVDTLMFCLNKGLGAPAGAMLCGSAEFIARSRINLRRLGGASMPQAGLLAAAGLVALQTMRPRLREDHVRAQRLASGIAAIPGVAVPHRVETNIVMASVEETGLDAMSVVAGLSARGVRALSCTDQRVRFVTHRHVTDAAVDHAIAALHDVARSAGRS